MSLRLRIFLGFASLFLLSSCLSLAEVFRLAQQVADDRGQAARTLVEQTLAKLREADAVVNTVQGNAMEPASAGEAATGEPAAGEPVAIGESAAPRHSVERAALLELNRLLSLAPVARKDLLLETMALFVGFLLIQLGALIALSALLARSVTRPLDGLLAGIRHATGREAGYQIPVLRGREFRIIGQEFNRLLADLDAQSVLLAEQSRLAAWQEVAGFLSHQLKNPLTAMGFAISNARLEPASRPGHAAILEESLAIIASEGERLANLVQAFRASTTCPEPRIEILDPHELVEALVARFAGWTPDGESAPVQWRVDIPEGTRIHADRQLLEEVLVNLCANSREAANGPVSISLTLRQGVRETILELRDSAGPVDPALAERILHEPFTTKAGGSGLGLMFVRLVMARHGGGVTVHREAEGQLVFRLHLPEHMHLPEVR